MIFLLFCVLTVILIRFSRLDVFFHWLKTLVCTFPQSMTLANVVSLFLLYICSVGGIAGIILAIIWRAMVENCANTRD